ncbi:MAG: MMPL family transporter [Deltaproteobacteria bacterium]|nr:MMPL family transporter [Deltaproteobacteria bacterium]
MTSSSAPALDSSGNSERPALRLLCAALCAGLLAALLIPAAGLRFDSDRWLPDGHPMQRGLDYLAEEFEPGEGLAVLLHLPGDFFALPDAERARIAKLGDSLAALPGVLELRSPLAARTIFRDAQTLQIRSFGNALETGAIGSAAELRRRFRASPYDGLLLAADGRTLAIEMRTDTRRRAGAREQLLREVERTMAAAGFALEASQPAAAALAGEAALNGRINRTLRSELVSLLAIGAAALAFFLALALRRPGQVAALLICTAASVLQCLAAIALLGHSLTPVSLCLPLLAAVIAVADGLHILAIWNEQCGNEQCGNAQYGNAPRAAPHGEALRQTIRRSWLPCMLTSLSSAAGFGAFALSELIPLRHFGLDSLAAIALCFPTIVGVLWTALWLFPAQLGPARAAQPGRAQHALLRLSALAAAHPRRVALAGLCASLLLAGLLGLARSETNFLSVFFHKSSAIHRAFNLADRELGGSGGLDLVLGEAPGHFRSLGAFQNVAALAAKLQSHPQVNRAESYLLPVSMVHRALRGGAERLPGRADELAQELFFLDLSRGERERDLLGNYLDFDGASTRLRLRTPNLGSQQLGALIAFAQGEAARAAPEARLLVTGSGAHIHELSRYVLQTQRRSFLLTLALVGALFALWFGPRLGLAGLLANIFPVLAATASICALRIPFDFATILVAGVTLGLSVDDSIHLLHHYRRARRAGEPPRSALSGSLRLVLRPVFLTSALFCLGLAVFFSSSLVILLKFAAFTIVGLLAALLSALVLLPALVLLLEEGRGRGGLR